MQHSIGQEWGKEEDQRGGQGERSGGYRGCLWVYNPTQVVRKNVVREQELEVRTV